MIRHALAAIIVPLLFSGWLGTRETIAVRTLALRTGDMPDVRLRGVKEHVALEFSAIQPGEMLRAMAANPLPLYLSGEASLSQWRGTACPQADSRQNVGASIRATIRHTAGLRHGD